MKTTEIIKIQLYLTQKNEITQLLPKYKTLNFHFFSDKWNLGNAWESKGK